MVPIQMALVNRRSIPRLPFHGKGILILVPEYFDVVLIDLSINGAHIILQETCDIRAEQHCALRIVNPRGRQLIEVEAVLAYRNPDGHAGVAFRAMTASIEREIRTIHEMNLGSESLLKRDLPALM